MTEGHTSHPENGNIMVELKFKKQFSEGFTCLLKLKLDYSVLTDFSRNETTDV